jgi:hypothetical protein
MGALHHPVSHREARRVAALDSKAFHANRESDDICDSVYRANLVKVDLRNRKAVDLRLDRRKTAECLDGALLNRPGEPTPSNDLLYLGKPARMRRPLAWKDANVGTDQASAADLLNLDVEPAQTELAQLRPQGIWVETGVD